MIFHHHTINVEHRVMMLALIYLYIKMLSEKIVSPLLCTVSFRFAIGRLSLLEKPYIDIAARTMIWDRIVKTQAITLENHHSNPMLGEKSRQLRNHTLLPRILLLNLLSGQCPLNLLHLRRLLIYRQRPVLHRLLDRIPGYGYNILSGRYRIKSRPINMIALMSIYKYSISHNNYSLLNVISSLGGFTNSKVSVFAKPSPNEYGALKPLE